MWITIIFIILLFLIVYLLYKEGKVTLEFDKEYEKLTKALVDIRFCEKTKENKDKFMVLLSTKRASDKMEDQKYNDLVNKIGELYEIRLSNIKD